MDVCCEFCVLSGRGLCDELITRPEESYRLWCVVVCDLENLKNEEAMTRVWSQRGGKKKSVQFQRHPLITSSYSVYLALSYDRVLTERNAVVPENRMKHVGYLDFSSAV